MISFLTIQNFRKYFLLMLLLTTALTTCKKDSDNSDEAEAEYYFKSSIGECSGNVNGNYYKGIILSSSNNIEVNAYITKKGSYSISTNNTNGTHFKASGIIKDTGEYTFRLQGYGTPVKKEITRYSLLASDQSACRFEIPVLDHTDSINTSEYAWEFHDNGVYHHGHIDSAYFTGISGFKFKFSGREATSNGTFEMSFETNKDQQISGTYTDSLNQGFRFSVDQQEIFNTNRKLSTVIIDSYYYIYDPTMTIIWGSFSWTGLNAEGVPHEVKWGIFRVRCRIKAF